jgi:multiple sugar transport system substrate-binding protein
MVHWKKGSRIAAAALSAALLLQGCAQGKTGGSEAPKEQEAAVPKISTDPVTITIWGSMSDQLFQKTVVDPVKLKYPHITMQMVSSAQNKMPDLIASGNVPDIIADSMAAMRTHMDNKLLEDMTPYVQKYKTDLGVISPVVLDSVRAISSDGKLLGLPISGNLVMMYYNKDLFDRFGVPYPKDGMTWDEVYALAQKVTRTEGGVAYKGFAFQDFYLFTANQLSLSFVDGKTEKSVVNSDGWKKLFETYARFFRIPGNEVDAKTFGTGLDQFLKDRTVAMYVTSSIFSNLPDAIKTGFNVDMVSLPSFSEAPRTTTQVDGGVRMISTTSKNKDQAYLALTAMLTNEAQSVIARSGGFPVMKDPKVMEQFGLDIEVLKDKNRLGFVYNKPAAPSAFKTKYDAAAVAIVRAQFRKMVLEPNSDVNTILREADELVNKAIKEAVK